MKTMHVTSNDVSLSRAGERAAARSDAEACTLQHAADAAPSPAASRQPLPHAGEAMASGSLLRDSIPGRIDIWIFVGIEAVIFASYFVAYMLHRIWDAELYLQSQQQLSQHFGAANTVILLLSSWLMASAVQSARESRYATAQKQVWATIAFGALFVGSKLVEWSTKMGDGITLTTNGFFTFYYFLTGIHVVHVLLGFGFLAVAIRQMRDVNRCSMPAVEACGIYWHMVDFLWVIIFALLYVMR
jgi:nitric oxide reductase NorE protein